MTRQTESQWSDFVYWIVMGLIYAEEVAISAQENSIDDMPIVNLFGQLKEVLVYLCDQFPHHIVLQVR